MPQVGERAWAAGYKGDGHEQDAGLTAGMEGAIGVEGDEIDKIEQEKSRFSQLRDHRHAVWSKRIKARFNGLILDQREATAETSIVSPFLFRKA